MIVQTAVNPANGHTYHAIGGDAGAGTTWAASEAFAVGLGAHLVTIDDAAENAWIASTFFNRYYVWIGLNDIAQEGSYVWSSGAPVGYTNWYPGEPNNLNNEDFVLMYTFVSGAGWNDGGISTTAGPYPFYGVAEVAPNAAPVPEPSSLTLSLIGIVSAAWLRRWRNGPRVVRD
jgi:hypothetical protein